MQPASRTPEGEPNRCPICGKEVRLEPSRPPGDAPCPHCGHLLWFPTPKVQATVGATRVEDTLRSWSNLLVSLPDDSWSLDGLISILVMHTGAKAGAIWISAGSDLELKCRFQRVAVPQNCLEQIRCKRLLERVAFSSQSLFSQAPPDLPWDEADSHVGNSLLLAIPIKQKDKVVAIVEIDQEPVATVGLQQSQLLFLERLCVTANDLIHRLLEADCVPAAPVSGVAAAALSDTGESSILVDSCTYSPETPVTTLSGTAVGKKRWWEVWKK